MIRVNKLILPLLVSILLSTVGTLKIGQDINSLFSVVLSPITSPSSFIRSLLNENFEFFWQLPQINRENQDLKKQNAALLYEIQNLKDAITDQTTLDNAKVSFKEIVPVRVISLGKTISATTSQSTDKIKPGQPVVSGTILLGIVESVSSPIIQIIPLDSENLRRFPIKTQTGQTGIYLFDARTPQIIDLPSENPINLNDSVLTLPTQLVPSGLVVGKITRIISSPQDPLQKAEVKLDSRFSSTTSDLIIITSP